MISPGWRGTGLDWTGLDWVVLDCSLVVTLLAFLFLSFHLPLRFTLLAHLSSPLEKSAALNIFWSHGMFELRYPVWSGKRRWRLFVVEVRLVRLG